MDEYQLGWQDPIEQLVALRVAVKQLLRRTFKVGENRLDLATSPLTNIGDMPERLKIRRENIINARIAIRHDYPAGSLFRFDLLHWREWHLLQDDILALYEACLLDIGRMYSMGGAAADWYDTVYPKNAEPRTVKPRAADDPIWPPPPFTGIKSRPEGVGIGDEVSMYSEGGRAPNPYKIDRVTPDGQVVERVAEYTTEAEAMAHPRRLDWNYRIYIGRRQLWPVKA